MKRYYFALTTRCNRECPLCSCYSDPSKKTFLSIGAFQKTLPEEGEFEIQFEGGEPTLHPGLMKMVKIVRDTGRCLVIRLCTNGVLLPYAYSGSGELDRKGTVRSLTEYFLSFGAPFQLKMSINSHLVERDKKHLEKAESIRDAFEKLKKAGEYSLVFNVRRNKKPLSQDDDAWLVEELERRGLAGISNVFFYQRYGRASAREELELPFIVPNPVDFFLINPDGSNHGTDLIGRAEAMGKLP